MATSVVMGNCSDHLDQNTRREMEISGLMNGRSADHQKPNTRMAHAGKPGGGGGGGGGRRKSKQQSELAQKKNKTPQRGMGVEKLERLRVTERFQKLTEISPPPPSHSHGSFSVLPNHQQFPPAVFGAYNCSLTEGGVGLGRGGHLMGSHNVHHQPGPMLFQGFSSTGYGTSTGSHHGAVFSSSGHVGPLFCEDTYLSDPFAFGLRNRVGNETHETSKELSSIPNNMKWYSEHCGFCHKKYRGNGENIMCNAGERKMPGEGREMMSPANGGFGSLAAGNKGSMFTGGNPCSFGSQTIKQEVEVMAVHSKGGGGSGSVVMEYEFFPAAQGKVSCNSAGLKMKTEASFSSQGVVETWTMLGVGVGVGVGGREAASRSAAPTPTPTPTASSCCEILSDHHDLNGSSVHQEEASNSHHIDLSLKLSSY